MRGAKAAFRLGSGRGSAAEENLASAQASVNEEMQPGSVPTLVHANVSY